MPDPRVLVILVATGAANPTSTAMTRATREALGVDARIEMRELGHAPTDADALAVEREVHPDAVVELTWGAANPDDASVRVHVVRTDRWIERSIGFAASDAPPERGRTLGFAVASMMPEVVATAASVPGPTSASGAPPSTAGETTTAPAATTPPDHRTETPLVVPVTPGSSPRPPPFAFDLAVLGTLGIGGSAGALGGAGGLHWFAVGPLSLRLGSEILGGSVDAAQGTLLDVEGSLGIALHPFISSPRHPLGVSVRADYVLFYEALTHTSPAVTSPVTQSRWLSAIDLVLEGDWLFSQNIGLLVGVGAQDSFSPTYVDLQGVRVATLPPLRAKAETGLRVRF